MLPEAAWKIVGRRNRSSAEAADDMTDRVVVVVGGLLELETPRFDSVQNVSRQDVFGHVIDLGICIGCEGDGAVGVVQGGAGCGDILRGFRGDSVHCGE